LEDWCKCADEFGVLEGQVRVDSELKGNGRVEYGFVRVLDRVNYKNSRAGSDGELRMRSAGRTTVDSVLGWKDGSEFVDFERTKGKG
jgi:hypothetical protein